MKVPLVAGIRTHDGRLFVLHDEVEQQPDWDQHGEPGYSADVYYWTEGNNSCDCNRALLIYRQYGEELPDDCGDTMTLTSLMINGVERLKEQ